MSPNVTLEVIKQNKPMNSTCKKKFTQSEKIAIVGEAMSTLASRATIARKYDISRKSLYVWIQEIAGSLVAEKPDERTEVLLQRQNNIELLTESDLRTKKMEVATRAVDLLLKRLIDEERSKYITNKDLVAMVKIMTDNGLTPQQTENYLRNVIESYERSKKKKTVASTLPC